MTNGLPDLSGKIWLLPDWLKGRSCYSRIGEEADLIFMDPPYGQGLEKQVMERLREADFVTADTRIIIETSLDTDFSWLEKSGFLLLREKRYKTNRHMFVRRA